jgi:hypothetical protein
MRTTIDLPDELFRQAKARAALDGLKLKELITRYVEQGLRQGSAAALPERPAEPPRQRSELPAPRSFPGRQIPALCNAEIEAILVEEDARRVMRNWNISPTPGEGTGRGESD